MKPELLMDNPKLVLKTEINTGFHVIKQSVIIQEDPEDAQIGRYSRRDTV